MDNELDIAQVRRTVVFVKKKNGSNMDINSNTNEGQSYTPDHNAHTNSQPKAQFTDRSESLHQLLHKNITTPKSQSTSKQRICF